jgi:hypothetical protein
LIILKTSSPAISPASFVACLCASLKYAGTVITAFLIFPPRYYSASLTSFLRINEDISCGVYFLFPILIVSPEPIFLLIDLTTKSGFIIAYLFAGSPTTISSLTKLTIDGVVLDPS